MKVLSWRGNVARSLFLMHCDFPAHCSGGRHKRLLVIHRDMKRLTTVEGSKWSRKFSLHQIWPGLNLSSDLSACSACSTSTHVCPVIRGRVMALSMFATEPPLHSRHEASPGLNAGGSMAWHELFCYTADLEVGSIMASLRMNTELFTEESQSAWQDQKATKDKPSKWHGLGSGEGCMEPPAKREGPEEVTQSQYSMLVCPGPRCSTGGMSFSSWPWWRSLWDGRGNTGLEFMISHTINLSLVFESFDLKSLVLSWWVTVGKPKFCETRHSARCSCPPDHWCVLDSTLWSVSPTLPGALCCLHRPVLSSMTLSDPWLPKPSFLPYSWLSPSSCNDLSTEMHLEIRWRARKRGKKMRKMKMERQENYHGNTDLSFLLLDTNKKLWGVRPHIFHMGSLC